MDRIDRQILHLLQERTKLSRRIGQAKRRHGALIYVPDRERKLIERVTHLTRGTLPVRAIAAIYREILSSSRAAQGEAAIGFFESDTAKIFPLARWYFGACAEFRPATKWMRLRHGLADGSLVLALLAGTDLFRLARSPANRAFFRDRLEVVGELSDAEDLQERIFIVAPRTEERVPVGTRALILIECKFTANAVKNWIASMSGSSIHLVRRALDGATLLQLTFARPAQMAAIEQSLRTTGLPFSTLGVYQEREDYGG